jgi:hypothetical protein
MGRAGLGVSKDDFGRMTQTLEHFLSIGSSRAVRGVDRSCAAAIGPVKGGV